jgi:hypothetical protein
MSIEKAWMPKEYWKREEAALGLMVDMSLLFTSSFLPHFEEVNKRFH